MDIFDVSSDVFVTQDGPVGNINLNRPLVKNALNMAMWQAVEEACRHFDERTDVRIVLLKSSTNGVFAAGADISELKAFTEDENKREKNRLAIRMSQRRLAGLSKPTVAVIDGPCVGGGCGLALHCDFRIATKQSVFGITPAKLGLVYPLSDTRRLIDIVGMQNARCMLLTAQLFPAKQAGEMGLIDTLIQRPELEKTVNAFCKELLSLSSHSLSEIKKIILEIELGRTDDDAGSIDAFLNAHARPDAAEGIAAFLEKRKPDFS